MYTTLPSLSRPVDERDHVLGPGSAPVTLVVYGDYECEYTRAAYGPVKEALREIGDQMRLAFRHFPLVTVHEHAQMAAEIAEAAGAQGKFWEMHSFLFEDQEDFNLDEILEHAAEMGLDVERMARELNEHTHAARIHEDVKSGIDSGVGETPSLFINTVQYSGPTEKAPLIASLRAAANGR